MKSITIKALYLIVLLVACSQKKAIMLSQTNDCKFNKLPISVIDSLGTYFDDNFKNEFIEFSESKNDLDCFIGKIKIGAGYVFFICYHFSDFVKKVCIIGTVL